MPQTSQAFPSRLKTIPPEWDLARVIDFVADPRATPEVRDRYDAKSQELFRRADAQLRADIEKNREMAMAPKPLSDRAWDVAKSGVNAVSETIDWAAPTVLRVGTPLAAGVLGSALPVVGTIAAYAGGAALGETLAQAWENAGDDGAGLSLSQIGSASALAVLPGGRMVNWAAKPFINAAMKNPKIASGVARIAQTGNWQALEQFFADNGAETAAQELRKALPRAAARAAAFGAVDAPVQGAFERAWTGKGTTARDILTDAAKGALVGPVTAGGGRIAQRSVQRIAPRIASTVLSLERMPDLRRETVNKDARSQIRKLTKQYENEGVPPSTAKSQAVSDLENQGVRILPSTSETRAGAFARGNIQQQQDQIDERILLANDRIDESVSQVNAVPLTLPQAKSHIATLSRIIKSVDPDVFKKEMAEAEQLLLVIQQGERVNGSASLRAKDMLQLKRFYDGLRRKGTFANDPGSLSEQDALKSRSDSVRSSLKDQFPGLRRLLDFSHDQYTAMDHLLRAGSGVSNDLNLPRGKRGLIESVAVGTARTRAAIARRLMAIIGETPTKVPPEAKLAVRGQLTPGPETLFSMLAGNVTPVPRGGRGVLVPAGVLQKVGSNRLLSTQGMFDPPKVQYVYGSKPRKGSPEPTADVVAGSGVVLLEPDMVNTSDMELQRRTQASNKARNSATKLAAARSRTKK